MQRGEVTPRQARPRSQGADRTLRVSEGALQPCFHGHRAHPPQTGQPRRPGDPSCPSAHAPGARPGQGALSCLSALRPCGCTAGLSRVVGVRGSSPHRLVANVSLTCSPAALAGVRGLFPGPTWHLEGTAPGPARTRPHRGREPRCRLPPRPRRPRHRPVTAHSRICPPHPSSCPRCAAETGVRVRHHQSCGTPVTPHAREGLPRGPAHARRLALMTRKPQNSIFHLQPPARDPVPAACALTLSQEPLSHQLPGHRAGDTVTAPSGWTVPCWSAAGRPGGPVAAPGTAPLFCPAEPSLSLQGVRG